MDRSLGVPGGATRLFNAFLASSTSAAQQCQAAERREPLASTMHSPSRARAFARSRTPTSQKAGPSSQTYTAQGNADVYQSLRREILRQLSQSHLVK